MKNLKSFFANIHNKFKKLIALSFYLFPINKNKIVFYNFKGNGFGDNPKYLANELLKHKKYKLIWFVKNLKTEMPNGIKKVKYGSLSALFHMITARLWIDNVRTNPKPTFKRKNQYYLQTWHGSLPYKAMEKDVENTLSPEYVKTAKADGKMCNFLLSNCKMMTDIYKRTFWFDGKMLEFGLPRHEALLNTDKTVIEDFKRKYNIQNKKIVLYAPSFRNDKNFYNNLQFDNAKLVKTLNKKLKKDFVFCYRLHPNDKNMDSAKVFKGGINLTQESDSQLVLSACDVVISDYSSMLLDFVLTKKVALVFAPDYNEYMQHERNLYVDIKTSGIPFSDSFEGLIENINKFKNKQYQQKINEFLKKYDIFDCSNASKKIVDYLIKLNVLNP